MTRSIALLLLAALAANGFPLPGTATAEQPSNPLLLQEDFEKGFDGWAPTDPKAWRIEQVDGERVAHQFSRSDYSPPHRSPFNMALAKDLVVGDVVLTARVRSTTRDYNHRDVCLFFGYQDPAHFYYVHLGKRTDDHANQIFIVNEAPRTKISQQTTNGTDWDDNWHQVKIVREVAGPIRVYFDDMQRPVMTANDTTFQWGQVGIGSFDDTAMWDDIRIRGTLAQPSSDD